MAKPSRSASAAEIRPDHISVAVESRADLIRILPKLNTTEVDHLLELESAGMRRPSFIARLIKRRTRIAELDMKAELMARYLGHEQKTFKDPGNPKTRKKAKKR